MVALLRGINVGGKTSLPMAELRSVIEACGYDDVQTYIQSGNVVLRTARRSTDTVAKHLETTIAARWPLAPEVAVRTRAELAAVVNKSPFLTRGEDAGHLHVAFMTGKATASTGSLDLVLYAPEEAIPVGCDLHLLLPGGVGRSKLATDLARQKGPRGTMRNWRTVTKLLEMAEATER